MFVRMTYLCSIKFTTHIHHMRILFFIWLLVVFFSAFFLRRACSSSHHVSKPVRQEVYTLWHFEEAKIGGIDYRFEISPGSVVIRYDTPYSGGGTSVYSGRWSGDYFVARQRDTIMRVGCDTVWMYPGCHRVDMYTR